MPDVALAAPHPAAVEAGRAAVAAGGNALDAALAAAAALTVVYPHQCSIGGDLIAVVRPAGGDTPGGAVGRRGSGRDRRRRARQRRACPQAGR